jgi:predicted SPOUT superfamily RNA methylase MTH1
VFAKGIFAISGERLVTCGGEFRWRSLKNQLASRKVVCVVITNVKSGQVRSSENTNSQYRFGFPVRLVLLRNSFKDGI